MKQNEIIRRAEEILSGPAESRQKMQEICELLSDTIGVFDWVGFYLVDPEEDRTLVLGPYVGEETDHTRIPFGRGICGQAAETGETFVVQDVSQASNYLACSVDVKSEIVVPIRSEGTLYGELDIDSHTRDAITEDHRALLEKIGDMMIPLFREKG